ncbi:NAD(P)/FAD-dependent oxidoreductase [Cyclobacterium marinum]|uniref:NADH:ubiquinone reductase (non-electrogenic) n=1 Tax=Cyclobacterium marinum (strain ATCC 25205 / DSM 745 / LMG 13164 / NCIMB 1802) TaxID=880070 RepID=G0IUS2_CYCMS|nr:NAD(P)/FAD-dependent oxidoreductase [Cyclobacterium marinum]AEL25464.1 FAD-dependent pyridine nucleotide-disulfide oxidoreductase [Cyclobacterium marinum DSM 745]MBI0400903.1 NAD(P)/FAD-dependent oxidoreductase [Cyclobacterium marinum]MBR9773994.1 NAD(P)/FAD-dependent oxidoreductase [Cytophagales bacterium]|tara:strand:+ start:52291 stop:53613 length:1323 start_codon:yes stop_codon:yes gene_type:complete
MDQPLPNLPNLSLPRIVVIGAGFAGLKLARKLKNKNYQVILLDKNNYHQFQPLFYQVATAGLEPSAISFPLRKVFHNTPNVTFRMAEAQRIDQEKNRVFTDIGYIDYDYLILAMGADTNYFGMKNIMENSIPMKSVSEALFIRNKIISNYERAINIADLEKRKSLMNVVIVGGGPTGVELAGAMAELRNKVFPKDYPQLNFDNMKVVLIEMGPSLLAGMSASSGQKAKEYLESLKVDVLLNTAVENYDGLNVIINGEEKLKTNTLLWAAGIAPNGIEGIVDTQKFKNGRLLVNEYNLVHNSKNIYALGDLCLQQLPDYPKGHPQVAQVAIQQADNLANNFLGQLKGRAPKAFRYKDLGSMATVGRKLAVVDLPFIKFQGVLAWLTWLFVHLMAILGVKNRIFIFLDWSWNYLAFDPSLRLLIRPTYVKPKDREELIEDKN